MRDIHPSWQNEDDAPVPVKVKESPVKKPQPTGQISRRPAAIVGMLAVIGIGITFFQGVNGLTGQLASGSSMIRITESGLEPSRLEVEHGQTITFRNDTDVPHILESDTLCSDTGFCLLTSTLFQGDTDNFTITPDMRAGSYAFASVIDSTLAGDIVIVTQAVENPADITANDFFSDIINNNPPSASGFGPSNFAPTTQVASGIPTNPYTVTSDRIHPFDSTGEPIPEAFGDDPTTPTPTERQMAATAIATGRGPITQPQTGAGVWAVLLGSIAGLVWVSRETMAQVKL